MLKISLFPEGQDNSDPFHCDQVSLSDYFPSDSKYIHTILTLHFYSIQLTLLTQLSCVFSHFGKKTLMLM